MDTTASVAGESERTMAFHASRDREGAARARIPHAVGMACLFGLMLLAGAGCSNFSGEWVQDATLDRTGNITSMGDERRLALEFLPPASVRIGFYVNNTGVVDPATLQNAQYTIAGDRRVATIGQLVARADGEYLIVKGPLETIRMKRVSGPAVFPRRVQIPQLTQQSPTPVPDRHGAALAHAGAEVAPMQGSGPALDPASPATERGVAAP